MCHEKEAIIWRLQNTAVYIKNYNNNSTQKKNKVGAKRREVSFNFRLLRWKVFDTFFFFVVLSREFVSVFVIVIILYGWYCNLAFYGMWWLKIFLMVNFHFYKQIYTCIWNVNEFSYKLKIFNFGKTFFGNAKANIFFTCKIYQKSYIGTFST